MENYRKLYSYIENNYDELCNAVKKTNIDYIINENRKNNNIYDGLNKEDFIIYMYLISIKQKNIQFLKYLDKLNETNKIDIVYIIYQRGLLNHEIIKKIIFLENNNYNIKISNEFLFSLIKNNDNKLFKTLYNNFIFNNSFIKYFLYQYKSFKNNRNNKNLKIISNSELNNKIKKETNKINLNAEDKNSKQTFLNFSISLRNEDIVNFLIKNGADVNKEDKNGKTPLMLACGKGYENIVKILIENGANVNKENKNGETPLLLANKSGNETIAKILIENGANVIKKMKTI